MQRHKPAASKDDDVCVFCEREIYRDLVDRGFDGKTVLWRDVDTERVHCPPT